MAIITRQHIQASRVSGSVVRVAMHRGSEHLVVPVVINVGDSVITPANSDGPEFIPASVISSISNVLSWNGRHVFPDHPNVDHAIESPETYTANDPRVVEALAFGETFNSRFDGNKHKVEAWLDIALARKIGSGAEEVVARLRSGEWVEVSAGSIVGMERKPGISPTGVPYEYIWRSSSSDHLAIGLSGSKGACSIDIGCGAGRVSSSGNSNDNGNGSIKLEQGFEIATLIFPKSKWDSYDEAAKWARDHGFTDADINETTTSYRLSQRDPDDFTRLRTMCINPNRNVSASKCLVRAVGGLIKESAMAVTGSRTRTTLAVTGLSDQDKRDLLQELLYDSLSDVNYVWVEAIYDETFVYTASKEGEPSQLYEQGYTLEGNTVTLSGNAKKVRRRVDYEPNEDTTTTTTTTAATTTATRYVGKKFLSALQSLGILAQGSEEGMSDVDLRDSIRKALRAVEPGFDGIMEIFPETSTIIYTSYPEDTLLYWRRTYEIDNDTVSLNEDSEQIEPITEWQPVQATQNTQVTAGETCQCHERKTTMSAAPTTDKTTTTTTDTTALTTEQKTDIVSQIIANSNGAYAEDDRGPLLKRTDSSLRALGKTYKPKKTDITTAATTNTTVAATTDNSTTVPKPQPLTEEQWLAQAPESVRRVVTSAQTQEQRRRDGLISRLKTAQQGFSEDDLKKFDTEDLAKLAKSHNLDQPQHDYSGQGLAGDGIVVEEYKEPVHPVDIALAKARGETVDETGTN